MKSFVPFVDLKPSLAPIQKDIERAIRRVLERGVFLRGPEVAGFEREWARYCGQRYCVACGSGTDALTLAALALDLRQAEVQANTLPLTALGLARGGAGIKLVDIDPRGRIRQVTPKSVPVLLYGRFPDPAEQKCRLFDAAHAHGWQPPPQATVCWSFYPTKNLGALGDIGAVTTNDSLVAGRLREFAGPDDRLRDARQINSRADELQAAALRVKLKRLDAWNAARRRIAEQYRAELPDNVLPMIGPGQGVFHLFAVRCPKRDGLARYLKSRGIQTKVHFPEPLHLLDTPWKKSPGTLPQAESWCKSILSLPCYPGLAPETVSRICLHIREYYLKPGIATTPIDSPLIC